jgi:hypothetical protein
MRSSARCAFMRRRTGTGGRRETHNLGGRTRRCARRRRRAPALRHLTHASITLRDFRELPISRQALSNSLTIGACRAGIVPPGEAFLAGARRRSVAPASGLLVSDRLDVRAGDETEGRARGRRGGHRLWRTTETESWSVSYPVARRHLSRHRTFVEYLALDTTHAFGGSYCSG